MEDATSAGHVDHNACDNTPDDIGLSELRLLVHRLKAGIDAIPPLLMAGEFKPSMNLSDCVRRLENERRQKHHFFPEHVVWDPAWPLLVELYRCRLIGFDASVTGLAVSVDVPSATGRRWIDEFERCDLATRLPSAKDRRTTLVCMTDNGFDRMSRYLAKICCD